jgi:predicted esterase
MARMRRMRARAHGLRTGALLGALGCALLAGHAGAPDAAEAPTGLQPQVTFSEYFPRASGQEIIRRLLTPITAAQFERTLAQSGQTLRAQAIDLSAERFALYVPAQAPPQGYALLVFVPPWEEAGVPGGWSAGLERYHTIFVSAPRSGNDADVLERRVPLALLAAENLMRRYPIDPQHVYVGGFSGGARIALRLALAYPELFRGALLNAGSDAIDAGPPAPPVAERLEQFQEGTRVIYLTGEYDKAILDMDADSRVSMRHWCVFDVEAQVTPKAGHAIADGPAFAAALRLLLTHSPPEAGRLAACRAALAKKPAAALQEVESLTAAGKREQAQKLLLETDRHYGGMAAPRSLELESALGWQLPVGR